MIEGRNNLGKGDQNVTKEYKQGIKYPFYV